MDIFVLLNINNIDISIFYSAKLSPCFAGLGGINMKEELSVVELDFIQRLLKCYIAELDEWNRNNSKYAEFGTITLCECIYEKLERIKKM